MRLRTTAILRGNGEYFAARGEHSSLSIRSDVKVRNLMAGIGPMLHRLIALAVHIDRQLFRLARFEIERIKIAAVFKNNRIRPQARPHDIELVELG